MSALSSSNFPRLDETKDLTFSNVTILLIISL